MSKHRLDTSSTTFGRWTRSAAVLVVLSLLGALGTASVPAAAVTSLSSTTLISEQTFFVYLKAGELPRYTFTQTAVGPETVSITVTDPTGTVQQQCTVPGNSANGVQCNSAGVVSPTSAGIWKIRYNPNAAQGTARYTWDISATDGGVDVPGRVWVERYTMSQIGAGVNSFSFWIGTREGYLYQADFGDFFGIVSTIESSGFGLTASPSSCVPLYKSIQGASGGNNDCGVDYKLFLESPAADLPASAPIAGGTDWIRPTVIPASVSNLTLQQNSPVTRAGNLTFDLAGVNGGYSIQLDTNNNGSYTDPVDRTIPWGSPPGSVSVPFNGLDGQGNALSVCDPMKAKVVVDKVGEAHLVLRDVEGFSGGLKITGATPGVLGANPKVYWDDRDLVPGPGQAVFPSADGRNGVDTSATGTGTHSWTNWGDVRSIDNWTYYQAQAGAEITIPDQCSPSLTLDKKAVLNDTNGNQVADLGETITYSFDVSNNGNASVSGVAVTDPKVTGITPASASLAPTASTTFTAAPYVVTNADLVAGTIDNTAVANGTSPVGPVTSNNDSTSTPTSPPPDFGDAPATYGTQLAGNGARHELTGYNRTDNTATLMLGSKVDFELNGAPNPSASGDDTAGIDDEDGVPGSVAMTVGQPGSLTVQATNLTANPSTLAGWVDLDADGTFEASERVVVAVPAGTTDDSFTLDFPGLTSAAATYARFRLFPGSVATPSPTGTAAGGEVEDHAVTTRTTALDITKTSTFDADTRPGDTVTYTVTATNNGTGAFTASNPAKVVDNLRDVLDDATYNEDAGADVGADPSYSSPNVVWTGALGVDETVTITYSVTVQGGGDGRLRNVAFQQKVGDPGPDPADCPDPSNPCAVRTDELPKLSLTKTASRNSLPSPGGQLTYTVTVTNTGKGDYTAAEPASFTDDLSDVLDDASFGSATASTGTASLAGQSLEWSGVLAAGESATITYTVTYTGSGDQSLLNSACVPVDEAQDPADTCRTTQTPGAGLRQTKSVDPASGTPVTAGQTLTYTLTFENVGGVDAVVDTTDNLSDVLDDGHLVGTIDAGAGLTAELNGSSLEISGTVPAGGTRTVSYQVQVDPYADQGDHILSNELACQPGDPPSCEPATTSNPVRHLMVTKSSDGGPESRVGDKVTYTVTLTNDGAGDYTAADPATLIDDLGDVLDDATYNGDADTDRGADPVYDEPEIRWSGALEAGDTVTLTYTVSLQGGGDGHVANQACSNAGVPCAEDAFDLPRLTIRKSSNRSSLPAVGETITYTVTVRNAGPGDYTAANPASFVDDLSDVLDDADIVPGSFTASTGDAFFLDPQLFWAGALDSGETATVTYSATYTAEGNLVVDNSACVPAGEALDANNACRTVNTPGSGLRHEKSVSPASGAAVEVGQVLTYTLSFENVGPAAAVVDTGDDLSDVLDDAELVGAPDADAGLSAVVDGDAIKVTGTVPTGETLTVTYQVRVKDFADQGDHVLVNALACEPGDPPSCDPETTTNPVRHLVLEKSVNPTTGVGPGDTVRYTLTLTNEGEGDYTQADPASLADDLAAVLDDADFDGDASASSGPEPSYEAPVLTWAGPLAGGDEVTIGYDVILKGGGDGTLANVACADPGEVCDEATFDLPKLAISKVADRTDLPAAGGSITYTVTVTNEGLADYTAEHPATFVDDLSEVLDDAPAGPQVITASAGGATFDNGQITWTGVLAAGDSATIDYTLTYQGVGDQVLINSACVPVTEAQVADERCTSVSVPGSGLAHRKSVSPASGAAVEVGQVLTYTLSFENVGPAAAVVDTGDDLSDVLDDAELVGAPDADAGLSAVVDGDAIKVTGTVPTGETLTVTYQVRVKDFADQGDHVLVNALACEPGDPPSCDPETTTNPVRHLVLEKSVNPTTGVGPGDTVRYTLTLTNEGEGDYTQADPASLADDLAAVLDDADFDGDASASSGPEPSYEAPVLTWAGPLAGGDEVTIGYDVILKGGGDGTLTNVAWEPDDPTDPGPRPDCEDPAAPSACDSAVVELPKLTVTKEADQASLAAVGDTITYTVTVANSGPGDYTPVHPASFVDDLSDVLDDAEFDGPSLTSSRGTADFTSPQVTWTGALDSGDSATITYTLTYTGAGDRTLVNSACVPAAEAEVPAENCAVVEVPGSGLVHSKSVDPASGTAVEVGQMLTYTLSFENLGAAAATVDTSDNLSDVLDDADLLGSPDAASGLTAVLDGDALEINGTVPAGQTLTVTYQVTVKDFADQGDHVLTNALACGAGEPDTCAPETTSNPVRHLVLTKAKTSPGVPDTGDVVTYELTVENDGEGDWTPSDPATVVDDLTGVLDDATWDGTASATSGTVSFDRPELSWSGALPHGTTVTITYSVTVTNQGDHSLANTAGVPDCALDECNPDPVITPLPHVVPDKTSDPGDGEDVQPGDEVTYTLSWANDGDAPGSVASTDDLAEILDDADLIDGPTSSSPEVQADLTGTELRITGTVAPDDEVTVTYTVRVKPAGAHGDSQLDNTLVSDVPQVTCTEEDVCTPVDPPGNHHDVGDYEDWKTVDPPTGSTVQAGASLTYTLHFIGTGTAPASIDRVDDVNDVLDDAVLTGDPVSSSPALTVSGPSGGRIAIEGTLAPDEEAIVSYTVVVKETGERGDDRLGNYLLDPGQSPPGACAGEDPERMDCTVNHVSDVAVTKASSPADGSKVGIGDDIAYTLTFRNVGKDPVAAPAPVDQTDHLSEVLDDARWKSGPSVSDTSLAATRTGDKLRVVGELAPGATVTVTYTVTVTSSGDGKIRNVVVPTGQPPVCAADSPNCTAQVSPVADTGGSGELPDTGSPVTPGLLGLGIFSLLLGLVIVSRTRRARA